MPADNIAKSLRALADKFDSGDYTFRSLTLDVRDVPIEPVIGHSLPGALEAVDEVTIRFVKNPARDEALREEAAGHIRFERRFGKPIVLDGLIEGIERLPNRNGDVIFTQEFDAPLLWNHDPSKKLAKNYRDIEPKNHVCGVCGEQATMTTWDYLATDGPVLAFCKDHELQAHAMLGAFLPGSLEYKGRVATDGEKPGEVDVKYEFDTKPTALCAGCGKPWDDVREFLTDRCKDCGGKVKPVAKEA